MRRGKIFFLIVLFTVPFMQPQSKFGLGVYGGTSIPSGYFNDFYNPQYEAGISLLFNYRSDIQIQLSSGYAAWSFDEEALNKYAAENGSNGKFDIEAPLKAVPLIISAKYFIGSSGIKPYLLVQAGAYFMSQTVKGTYTENGVKFDLPEEDYSSTETLVGIGAGLLIPVTNKIFFDAQGAYIIINDSQIAGDVNSTSVSLAEKTISTIKISAGVNFYF